MGAAALQNGFPRARGTLPRTSATIIRGPWRQHLAVPVRAPLPALRHASTLTKALPGIGWAALLATELQNATEYRKRKELEQIWVNETVPSGTPLEMFKGFTKAFTCYPQFDPACYSTSFPANSGQCSSFIVRQGWPVAACTFATATPLSSINQAAFTSYSAPQYVAPLYGDSYPIAKWVSLTGLAATPARVNYIAPAPLGDAISTYFNPLAQPYGSPLTPWVPSYNLRPSKLRAPRRGYVEVSEAGYNPPEPSNGASPRPLSRAAVSAGSPSSTIGGRPPANTREVKGAFGRNVSAALRFGRMILGTYYAWDQIDDWLDAMYDALPASLRFGSNKLVPPERGMSKLSFQLWQNGEKARVIAENLSRIDIDKMIDNLVANQFSELQNRAFTLRSGPANRDTGHWFVNEQGNWQYDPF